MVCKTYPILWFVRLSAFNNNIRFVLARYVFISVECVECVEHCIDVIIIIAILVVVYRKYC